MRTANMRVRACAGHWARDTFSTGVRDTRSIRFSSSPRCKRSSPMRYIGWRMKNRTLGRTEIQVSEIGYGAWGIGGAMWAESDDKQSIEALEKAISLGLNFIDTAYAYGDGHSEQLIAK